MMMGTAAGRAGARRELGGGVRQHPGSTTALRGAPIYFLLTNYSRNGRTTAPSVRPRSRRSTRALKDTQRETPSHATCQPERGPIAMVYVGKICSRLGVHQTSILIAERPR